jgi:hypothetical protein
LNGGDIITFAFFDFSSFGLLVCLEKPLEVVVFEFADVLMLELFSDLNRFIPTVKLLVHSHSFFNLIVLNQDSLSLVELLIQHSELCLDSKVVDSFLSDQFV